MVRNTRGNFKPELRVYNKEECTNLTSAQKSQVHDLKLKNGRSDGCMPPAGFQINHRTGEAEPTSQLVSTIRVATTNIKISHLVDDQNNFNPLGPPHLVGGSTNEINDSTSSVWIRNSF